MTAYDNWKLSYPKHWDKEEELDQMDDMTERDVDRRYVRSADFEAIQADADAAGIPR